MHHSSLDDFLRNGTGSLKAGPVAVILVEDEVEVASTLAHHLDLGFASILALMPPEIELPDELEREIHRVNAACIPRAAAFEVLNRIIVALPDIWLYYCYNAEYLYFPFCENRTIGEMLDFHAQERRDAMLTYVVDLYAADLARYPDAVARERAMLDRTGYFAEARVDPATGHPRERQLDFSGGLRWRFEEHIPKDSRRIDRIALFRSRPGLVLHRNHTFNEQEYNTYACPWHHNLTAAICSFRAAKALKRNPGSTFDIPTFHWRNSIPFEWTSQQLLDLGLIEPGQWF